MATLRRSSRLKLVINNPSSTFSSSAPLKQVDTDPPVSDQVVQAGILDKKPELPEPAPILEDTLIITNVPLVPQSPQHDKEQGPTMMTENVREESKAIMTTEGQISPAAVATCSKRVLRSNSLSNQSPTLDVSNVPGVEVGFTVALPVFVPEQLKIVEVLNVVGEHKSSENRLHKSYCLRTNFDSHLNFNLLTPKRFEEMLESDHKEAKRRRGPKTSFEIANQPVILKYLTEEKELMETMRSDFNAGCCCFPEERRAKTLSEEEGRGRKKKMRKRRSKKRVLSSIDNPGRPEAEVEVTSEPEPDVPMEAETVPVCDSKTEPELFGPCLSEDEDFETLPNPVSHILRNIVNYSDSSSDDKMDTEESGITNSAKDMGKSDNGIGEKEVEAKTFETSEIIEPAEFNSSCASPSNTFELTPLTAFLNTFSGGLENPVEDPDSNERVLVHDELNDLKPFESIALDSCNVLSDDLALSQSSDDDEDSCSYPPHCSDPPFSMDVEGESENEVTASIVDPSVTKEPEVDETVESRYDISPSTSENEAILLESDEKSQVNMIDTAIKPDVMDENSSSSGALDLDALDYDE